MITNSFSGHFEAMNECTDSQWDGIVSVIASELQAAEVSSIEWDPEGPLPVCELAFGARGA